MRSKFTSAAHLPDYLEDALEPFAWTGVFSADFRTCIISCIFASNRKEVTADFVKTLRTLQFFDAEWIEQLSAALTRFAEEGFKKS